MTLNENQSKWGWLRTVRYRVLLTGVLLITAVVVFFRVGRWLVVEDPLGQANVIVVLSGRMPMRALEAAKIYEQGFAARVWVLNPHGPGAELKKMGIAYVGEEFYSRRVLMAEAVPSDAIRVLERETGNTEDELTEVIRLMREEGVSTAIVVTSKPHTRRVRAIWNRLANEPAGTGANPKLIVRYAADDPYDAAHWWRNTRDALDVVREVFGLMNVWAGFPVRYVAR